MTDNDGLDLERVKEIVASGKTPLVIWSLFLGQHPEVDNMVDIVDRLIQELELLRGDISFLDEDRPEGKELSDLRKFKLMIDDIGMLFPKSHYATSLLKKMAALKQQLAESEKKVEELTDFKLRGF